MSKRANEIPEVFLKKGHIQPVYAGHPWVFRQAIERVNGTPNHGDEVRVIDSASGLLGRGFFSTDSALGVRIFSRGDRAFDEGLVMERLAEASSRRRLLLESTSTTGYRAFHGEGDGIPGLIVDRFGDSLVLQFGIAGLARVREIIVAALGKHFEPVAIYDRTTEKAAASERFERVSGLVQGTERSHFSFLERGLTFDIPAEFGQKTGFYFDQRPLRARVEELSRGKEVLDLYSYVGAAGFFAARGGASRVDSVDSSEPALSIGRTIAERQGLPITFHKSDALDFLKDRPKSYDLVLSDPPKLAQSRAGRDKALYMFKRVARESLLAVRPGGLLALSSCSAAIGLTEVQRALALAAREVGRRATVLERIFQGPDHPVPPAFPEGLYLSTVIAEIT